MESSVEEIVVKKAVRVNASIERAFRVFVEQMETWWPKGHHIGAQEWELILVEPRVGGRWYEQDAAGQQFEWGTVLQWEPPNKARFRWHLGPLPGSGVWGLRSGQQPSQRSRDSFSRGRRNDPGGARTQQAGASWHWR